MESFGVNFRIDAEDLYPALVDFFEALKQAKAAEDFRDVNAWAVKLNKRARSSFSWPPESEQAEWSSLRANSPVVVTHPEDALGEMWDLGSLLDAVESGEYSLLEIVRTSETTAELRIDPEAYPYGGIGAFIALVEAHGMHVLGVNEYGKYQARNELLR